MQNSTQAVGELLQHAAWMRHLAAKLLQEKDQAEDIVQQSWIAAMQHPQQAKKSSWLAGVVKKLSLQANRTNQRRQQREQKAAKSESTVSVQHLLAQVELQKQIAAKILELPAEYRDVLLFYFYENLTFELIAAKLAVPKSTVRYRFARSLEILRKQLRLRRDYLSSLFMLGAFMQTKAKIMAVASVLLLGVGMTIVGVSSFHTSTSSSVEIASKPQSISQIQANHFESSPRNKFDGSFAQRVEVEDANAATNDVEQGNDIDQESENIREIDVDDYYLKLKLMFEVGGWEGVRLNMFNTRGELASSNYRDRFLELLDADIKSEKPKDHYFLEALLFHLSRSKLTFRQSVEVFWAKSEVDDFYSDIEEGYIEEPEIDEKTFLLEDEILQDELWRRYQEIKDPLLRKSFLSFFVYDPRLRAQKLQDFIQIVQFDSSNMVRAEALSALEHFTSQQEVVTVLEVIAMNDSDPQIRAQAFSSLGEDMSANMQEVVKELRYDSNEWLRSAYASFSLDPVTLDEKQELLEFFASEFQHAKLPQYKGAILDRLFSLDKERLKRLLAEALIKETSQRSKNFYSAYLEEMEYASELWELERLTRDKRNKFYYGED